MARKPRHHRLKKKKPNRKRNAKKIKKKPKKKLLRSSNAPTSSSSSEPDSSPLPSSPPPTCRTSSSSLTSRPSPQPTTLSTATTSSSTLLGTPPKLYKLTLNKELRKKINLRMYTNSLARQASAAELVTTSNESLSLESPSPPKKRKLCEEGQSSSMVQIDDSLSESDSTAYEMVTIKCGLKHVCPDAVVFERINADVVEISDLMVEASIYAHFCLSKDLQSGQYDVNKKIDFFKFFYSLKIVRRQNKKKPNQYNKDMEYNQIREKYKLRNYDGDKRTNLIVFAVKQYETVFVNNIWMHMYTRVRRFCKSVCPTIKSYETLDWLFNLKSKYLPDADLINAFRKHLDYDTNVGKERFSNVKKDWYKHLPFLYKLQRYYESKKLKSFRLIPLFSHGRKHIRYDTQALGHMLMACSKLKKGTTNKVIQDKQDENWKKWFKVGKFETANKKFAYTITTDGVTISLQMKKLLNNNEEARTQINFLERIESKYYNRIVGADPGRKLLFGMVNIDAENKDKYENITIKSGTFPYLSGEYMRKKKLLQWTKDIEREMRTDRESRKREQELEISSMTINYFDFADFSLKYIQKKQLEYCKRKVARLKLNKYMLIPKAVKSIVDGINLDKKTLLFIGSTHLPANSPIKGYGRVPQPKILKELKRRCDVVEVDEFRTTVLCSKCHNECIVSRNRNRYALCPKCHITWNRDINAANNMQYKGMCMLKGEKLHYKYYYPAYKLVFPEKKNLRGPKT